MPKQQLDYGAHHSGRLQIYFDHLEQFFYCAPKAKIHKPFFYLARHYNAATATIKRATLSASVQRQNHLATMVGGEWWPIPWWLLKQKFQLYVTKAKLISKPLLKGNIWIHATRQTGMLSYSLALCSCIVSDTNFNSAILSWIELYFSIMWEWVHLTIQYD